MGLTLGKTFDRSYNLRLPFLMGFYNIGIYFSKKSPFLLFSLDSDFPKDNVYPNIKVNMFKNLKSSRFCETFLELHDYRKQTLDIQNQFERVKDEYYSEIVFLLNETMILSKYKVEDRGELFDTLSVYGFTMSSYYNEFIFLLAERQNIILRLDKKIVRTSAIQISTSASLQAIDEFYKDLKTSAKLALNPRFPSKEVIKLE